MSVRNIKLDDFTIQIMKDMGGRVFFVIPNENLDDKEYIPVSFRYFSQAARFIVSRDEKITDEKARLGFIEALIQVYQNNE